MALKSIRDTDLKNKKVIARFDFNVPLDKNNNILDTTRIDLAIPTIQFLLESEVKKIVLISHLGRPNGKRDKNFSLDPVATYLSHKLEQNITLTETALDNGIKHLLKDVNTRIIMLENIRFHKEEELGDLNFAKSLSCYGDIYLNEAFGTCHRKHSSTYYINHFFKRNAYCGDLILREVNALDKIVKSPKKPFVAVVGGAKVSDKIKIIEKLLPIVDKLIIGGAMAYPFLEVQGHSVGKSLCREEDILLANGILDNKHLVEKIFLPVDHVVAPHFDCKKASMVSTVREISDDMMGLDIGDASIFKFKQALQGAKTILWNGPMGMFENPLFKKGTLKIASIITEQKDCFSLVGGGDSVSAINQLNMADKMSHISTGGGASLKYLEDGSLPGIDALKFGID